MTGNKQKEAVKTFLPETQGGRNTVLWAVRRQYRETGVGPHKLKADFTQ